MYPVGKLRKVVTLATVEQPNDSLLLNPPLVEFSLIDELGSTEIGGTYTIGGGGQECENILFAGQRTAQFALDYLASSRATNDVAGKIDLIESGLLTVQKNGATYALEWRFLTNDRYTISGTYTGPIEVR